MKIGSYVEERDQNQSFLFYMTNHLVLIAGRASSVLPNQVNLTLSPEQLGSYELWEAAYGKWEEQVSLQNNFLELSICMFLG